MAPTCTLYFMSLGFLLVVLASVAQGSYQYSALCSRLCSSGRGGNLCRCSAVHFAGKRSGESYAVDTSPHVARGTEEAAYLLQNDDELTPDADSADFLLSDGSRGLLRQLMPQLQRVYHDAEEYHGHAKLQNHRNSPDSPLARFLDGRPFGPEDSRLMAENAEDDLGDE